MPSTTTTTIAAGLWMAGVLPLFAAPQKCPLAVETKQSIQTTPAGWTVLQTPAPSRLTRVAIFDGPPREEASLKPDNGDTDEAPVWTLSPDNPRGYWLVCYYDDTSIALSKRLPGKVSNCRAVLDRYSALREVECRP